MTESSSTNDAMKICPIFCDSRNGKFEKLFDWIFSLPVERKQVYALLDSLMKLLASQSVCFLN